MNEGEYRKKMNKKVVKILDKNFKENSENFKKIAIIQLTIIIFTILIKKKLQGIKIDRFFCSIKMPFS